jgi:glycosyltransferase involved in cell wall biosynthesis
VAKGSVAVAGVARFKRRAPRRLAGLQSVSSFVDEMNARHFLGTGFANGAKRFTIPPAVDVDPPDPQRVDEILAKLPKDPFIMFVGALRRVKGVDVLLDAYRRLENPPPLVLMGTIERDTPNSLPDGVIVLTDVPHEAVMAAWHRAMMGVVPSVWPEPLGTVSMEGVKQGVPMIATVPSGMVDVLGDGAGILVPQGDAAALADAMRSLIADPGRREALREAARARSDAFEPEVVVSRYEQMLGEFLQRR